MQNGFLRRPYRRWKKKRSKAQRRKGKIYPSECRIQRIARTDMKALLSEQCKKIEESNTMGQTRDVFKKIRERKGTFHVMMGTVKGRRSMPLREAEGIKKRWQEYTEELYRKGLNDPDDHKSPRARNPGVWSQVGITTNKASGGDGIPAELFQMLTDDAVKVLHLIFHQIWKTQQWLLGWKKSDFIPVSRRTMPKKVHTTTTQLGSFHMLAS